MVLLASAFDQSRFLRADEVPQEKLLRIKRVTAETLTSRQGSEQKLVLWFTNLDKGLVLNKINIRTIQPAYGDDTAGWVNKLIAVFAAATTDPSGRPTMGLRIRIPPPKQASGNGQAARPAPVQNPLADDPPSAIEQFAAEHSPSRPITTPEPPAPDHDDFDDEIPF